MKESAAITLVVLIGMTLLAAAQTKETDKSVEPASSKIQNLISKLPEDFKSIPPK